MFVSEFGASLGSTMDTCLRQSMRLLEDFHMLGPSYSAQILVRRLRRAQAYFHGLAVQQTMVIPRLQLLNAVIDVPVVLVMQVHFQSWSKGRFSWSSLSGRP